MGRPNQRQPQVWSEGYSRDSSKIQFKRQYFSYLLGIKKQTNKTKKPQEDKPKTAKQEHRILRIRSCLHLGQLTQICRVICSLFEIFYLNPPFSTEVVLEKVGMQHFKKMIVTISRLLLIIFQNQKKNQDFFLSHIFDFGNTGTKPPEKHPKQI